MKCFKTLGLKISGFIIFFYSVFNFPYASAKNLTSNTPHQPKLIVGIVVDQLRYDYLQRFDALFLPVSEKSGGFRKLKQLGASFSNCNYAHSATNTGPGQATFLTGYYPKNSGIITNNWYDRLTNKVVYCVEDTSAIPVGCFSEKRFGERSPKNLLVPTLGDRLKNSSPHSKVIGLALKDRGAILPAGHKADAAYWFDAGSGKWISSIYYFPNQKLPKWVENFNQKNIAESYLGKTWHKLLSDKEYPMFDDVYGEGMIPGELKRTFPHKIIDLSTLTNPRFCKSKRFDAFLPSPFGHELTTQFAKDAVVNEKLGQRGVTDILTISYSSLDYCGHIFGPMSQEVQDIVVRLDRQLDDFFEFLDQQVGLENCLIVLTADHGVCPLPEFMDDGKRLDQSEILDSIKIFVEEKYPNIIQYFSYNEILLNHQYIEDNDLYPAEIENFVANQIKKLSYVQNVYKRSELIVGGLSGIGKAVLNSFNPSRSGDIYIVYKPHTIVSYQSGTTHGSPYNYDSHVPLMIYGKGIGPAQYNSSCSPAAIAPTLHHILKLPPLEKSAYDGRVLSEIF